MLAAAYARPIAVASALALTAACSTVYPSESRVFDIGLQEGADPTMPQAEGQQEQTEKDATWKPPEPKDDAFDWIQLTSGEWLKGEIQELRTDSLEFESDELDELTLDWEDVAQLRAARPCTMLFEGQHSVTGTVLIRDKEVLVGTPAGIQRFERRMLISLVPGIPSERNYWSGKLSFGASVRTGNTEQSTSTPCSSCTGGPPSRESSFGTRATTAPSQASRPSKTPASSGTGTST